MEKLERILIATKNPAKKQRYSRWLRNLVNKVVGVDDLGITDKPEETGETAERNAEIKARFYAKKSGLIALSEDEALYVDFLQSDNQPSVHVRRINKRDEVSDGELLSYWENIISKVPKNKRTGKWHIAYCLATPQGTVQTIAQDYPILFFSPPSKVRLPGWPMSSLEGPVLFGKPHSELNPKENLVLDRKAKTEVVAKLGELLKILQTQII